MLVRRGFGTLAAPRPLLGRYTFHLPRRRLILTLILTGERSR